MFEDPKEQALYESMMNGLRQQGWDRIEADNEAYNRVIAARKNKN